MAEIPGEFHFLVADFRHLRERALKIALHLVAHRVQLQANAANLMSGRRPHPAGIQRGGSSRSNGRCNESSSVHNRVYSLRYSGESLHKKAASAEANTALCGNRDQLEVKAQPQLHPAAVVRVGQMQERPRAKVSVDGVQLSVVEKVEVFPAEVESRPLVNWESLEQSEVKVDAPREIHGVSSDIAKRQSCGRSESTGITHERPTLRSVLIRGEARMWIASQVRPRTRTHAVSDACIVAE